MTIEVEKTNRGCKVHIEDGNVTIDYSDTVPDMMAAEDQIYKIVKDVQASRIKLAESDLEDYTEFKHDNPEVSAWMQEYGYTMYSSPEGLMVRDESGDVELPLEVFMVVWQRNSN